MAMYCIQDLALSHLLYVVAGVKRCVGVEVGAPD